MDIDWSGIVAWPNVDLGGSTTWEGVVLAGGSIRSNGNNSVRRAVIAGLNVKLGEMVPTSEMNGAKSYLYDSCALTRALGTSDRSRGSAMAGATAGRATESWTHSRARVSS